MRAFAVGAYPKAVRNLRDAVRLSPQQELDPRALRVLGKALLFTEQQGHDETRRAFDELMAAGERSEAAVAAMDLALALWQRGDGRGTADWTTRSLQLVAAAPASLEKAHVLAQAARLEMLAGRPEVAIAMTERALALAEEFGPDAPRASALVTQATARANIGDYDTARRELEAAREIAARDDPSEVGRVYVNSSSILIDLGELEEGIAVARQGIAHHERSGMLAGTGGFIYGNLCEAYFTAGAWDEAARIAAAELERAKATGGLYYEPFYRYISAAMAHARAGDVDAAVAAARLLVEGGKEREDDQAVYPSWSTAAWLLAQTGHEDEAGRLVDELLERRRANPRGVMPGYWITQLALALERLGRSGELETLAEPPGSRFLLAARAVDEGRFDDAADVLAEIGAPLFEAEVRILAARNDRDPEAQLGRARELLAGLGATARLRELGEEQPEVSSRSGGT
jgi:tetratricopeptide (TPR) repeat protein